MTCQLLLGLTASDDIMVNASRRLIDKTRCEHWIVENMRSMCLAKNTGGHWTHFYSSSIMAEARDGRGGHCCRSCVYCAVLAARLCNHPERGAVMIKRLQTAGLPLLLHAVPIDNANAAAEAVLQSQAVHRLNGSSRGSSHQILGTVQEDSDLEVVINKEKDADGHHELIKGPLNEMEGAVGDFLFPLFTLESGSKELPIPHRAVEYCGNISAHAFDLHVMYLFRQFHLTYGPRTAGEKVFVANVQAVPGALNAAPEPHHPIVD